LERGKGTGKDVKGRQGLQGVRCTWAELSEIERKIGPWKEGTPRLEATSRGHLKKGLRYLSYISKGLSVSESKRVKPYF
jgi:hypothetical protein